MEVSNLDKYIYRYGFIILNAFEMNASSSVVKTWKILSIGSMKAYVHPEQHIYVQKTKDKVWFLIGHAYNPFNMKTDENEILAELIGRDDFFGALNELTGLFALGCVEKEKIFLVGDAAGMQTVFYGYCNGHVCVSSHTELIGDIFELKHSTYVDKLINYRWYHLFGMQLPGDYSPYEGIYRLIPNHYVELKADKRKIVRFWPEVDYTDSSEKVQDAADILHNSMELIAKKWKKPAISLTGGCDSKTTLACTRDLYDRFSYFSYISSDEERVDAEAAHRICESMGIEHHVDIIERNDDAYNGLDSVEELLLRNTGHIGQCNPNDVRKRAFYMDNFPYDVEVKSWVSEAGRAYYCKRFNKKYLFRNSQLTGKMLTVLYKVFLTNRELVHETNDIFEEYIRTYMLEKEMCGYPWQELFFWEFRMSAWNGLVISGEHRTSFEITIPYNNRKLIDLMVRMPLQDRINDNIHKAIRQLMNPEVDKLGISITNVKHTNRRAQIEGLYVDIMSRLPF